MIYFAFDVSGRQEDMKTKIMRTIKFWIIFMSFIKLKIQYIVTIILIVIFFQVIDTVMGDIGPIKKLDSIDIMPARNQLVDEPFHDKIIDSIGQDSSGQITEKQINSNATAYKIIALIFIAGILDNAIEQYSTNPEIFSPINMIFGKTKCDLPS